MMGQHAQESTNTIYYFNGKKVPIHFISQGLTTLEENGKENAISKMMISILGIFGEMEKTQIRERQLEGIKLAKLKGVYKGRVTGSKEDVVSFLSKKGNKEALGYLKKGGLKAKEIATLTGLHINTITKIKKVGLTPKMEFCF